MGQKIAGTTGTVLVVEDDPQLRLVAVELYRALGFDVLTAEDAPAALEILRGDEHVDLLFSDVVMPKAMSGADLAREAMALRPGLKILLASGYPLKDLVEKGLTDDMAFISKPYRVAELADRMREFHLLE